MKIIVIVTLAILILSGLIVYRVRNRKARRRKRLFLRLSKLGTAHNLSFSSHMVAHKSVIGIDGIRRKLLVLKYNHPDYKYYIIDLEFVKSCRFTLEKSKADPEQNLNTIRLEFEFRNKRKPFMLPFYSRREVQPGDFRKMESAARRWEAVLVKMLNPHIKVG